MAESATAMVLSLVGLQALRKRAITKGEPTRGELLQELCEPLLDLARRGQLSHAMAMRLLSGAIVGDAESEVVRALSSKKKLPSILRFLFTSKVSWAVFTTEWIDGVAAFLTTLGLQGKRVLEWVATDVTLRETAVSQPLELAALDAVRKLEPSAVFWSWWSEGATPMAAAAATTAPPALCAEVPAQCVSESESARAAAAAAAAAATSMAHGEDRLVAEHCIERGLPILFVGESRGGVTGSTSFWAGPWRPALLSEVVEGFQDVPNWEGQFDRTWCLRPGAETLPPMLRAAVSAVATVGHSSSTPVPPPPSPAPLDTALESSPAVEVH